MSHLRRPQPTHLGAGLLLAVLVATLVPISHRPASAAEPGWKAGVSRAVITPEKGVWLAGYGSKRPPDGKIHDLWMKALALEDQAGRRVVLITSDFQGVPKSMSDRVFARLAKEQQLEREQIMFTFSHNHCGPRLGDDLVDYYPVEPEQVESILSRVSGIVAGRSGVTAMSDVGVLAAGDLPK